MSLFYTLNNKKYNNNKSTVLFLWKVSRIKYELIYLLHRKHVTEQSLTK